MFRRNVSYRELARLWVQYVEAAKSYQAACRATDAASARLTQAYNECEAAAAAEGKWGRAFVLAQQAWRQACAVATDSEVLANNGTSKR